MFIILCFKGLSVQNSIKLCISFLEANSADHYLFIYLFIYLCIYLFILPILDRSPDVIRRGNVMHRTTMPDGLAVLHIGWLHVIIEEEKTRQSKAKVLIRLRG